MSFHEQQETQIQFLRQTQDLYELDCSLLQFQQNFIYPKCQFSIWTAQLSFCINSQILYIFKEKTDNFVRYYWLFKYRKMWKRRKDDKSDKKTVQKKLSKKQRDLLQELLLLDEQYISYRQQICGDNFLQLTSKHNKILLIRWLEKLDAKIEEVAWKKNRNNHVKLLYLMSQCRSIQGPFMNLPPEGDILQLKNYQINEIIDGVQRYVSEENSKHGVCYSCQYDKRKSCKDLTHHQYSTNITDQKRQITECRELPLKSQSSEVQFKQYLNMDLHQSSKRKRIHSTFDHQNNINQENIGFDDTCKSNLEQRLNGKNIKVCSKLESNFSYQEKSDRLMRFPKNKNSDFNENSDCEQYELKFGNCYQNSSLQLQQNAKINIVYVKSYFFLKKKLENDSTKINSSKIEMSKVQI